MFAYFAQQGQPWDRFRAVFDAFWGQREGSSASFSACWRNVDSLTHTRDQGTFEKVDITQQAWSSEVEDCFIGRKDDGHRFWGFKTRDLPLLPGERRNGHKAVSGRITGPIRRLIEEKELHLTKINVLFYHEVAPAHT